MYNSERSCAADMAYFCMIRRGYIKAQIHPSISSVKELLHNLDWTGDMRIGICKISPR